MEKDKKGISLIVLVITIIVIIILAAAVILALNKNNPIENANKASFQQDLDSYKSDLDLTHSKKIADNVGEYDIAKENFQAGTPEVKLLIPSLSAKYVSIIGIQNGKIVVDASAVKPEQVEWAKEVSVKKQGVEIGKVVDKNITFDKKDKGEATNPLIPKGFAPINEGEALWGEENATNKGLVIVDKSGTDTDGNEFVWIPVLEFSEFIRTDDYYNGTGITTAQCAELKPGESNATEEVKAMYKSVETNGGFYIARYEAGKRNSDKIDGTIKPVLKKGAVVWVDIPWGVNNSDSEPGDGAVTISRKMYAPDAAVASTLMYGVQFDAVLRFIEKSGAKTLSQLKDSTTWGNHYNGTSKLESTATSDIWKVNNIYDLAGNAWEWTMEEYIPGLFYGRVYRSGGFNKGGGTGFTHPISRRSSNSVNDATVNIGFRPALYIK